MSYSDSSLVHTYYFSEENKQMLLQAEIADVLKAAKLPFIDDAVVVATNLAKVRWYSYEVITLEEPSRTFTLSQTSEVCVSGMQ